MRFQEGKMSDEDKKMLRATNKQKARKRPKKQKKFANVLEDCRQKNPSSLSYGSGACQDTLKEKKN